MARWSSIYENWTPAAVADTTNLTDAGYHAIQGGSATQRIKICEINLSGINTASAVNRMVLARDSTVGATLSGTTLAAHNPSTAALAAPPVSFHTATTEPQRSATLKLYTPQFNAFGGLINLAWAPGEETIEILGNTASFGEMSLSCPGGSPGLMSSTIVIEPF